MKLELRAITNSHGNRAISVVISSTMPSAKYSCSGSPDMFWNGSTASDGLSGSGSGDRLAEAAGGAAYDGADADAVGAHRPGDVLDLLLAHVLERDVELVAHLVAHRRG